MRNMQGRIAEMVKILYLAKIITGLQSGEIICGDSGSQGNHTGLALGRTQCVTKVRRLYCRSDPSITDTAFRNNIIGA